MTTRSLIIAIFVLLAFAPPAFAQSSCGSGSSCLTQCGAAQVKTGTCVAGDGSQGLCCTTPSSGGTNPGQPTSGGTNPGTSATTLINPLQGGATLQGFLQQILQFVVKIGAIVVVLMLVFVGYKFVVAQGEPAKIAEARSMLLWTIVGALILLGAQALALGIQATVNALSAGN
jgi:hypothetical protein